MVPKPSLFPVSCFLLPISYLLSHGCHMDARSLPLIGIPEPTAAPATSAPADLRSALERHHAESLGWAMACCGFDRSEAGDVLQDAYLKVLDGRAVYRCD